MEVVHFIFSTSNLGLGLTGINTPFIPLTIKCALCSPLFSFEEAISNSSDSAISCGYGLSFGTSVLGVKNNRVCLNFNNPRIILIDIF